MRRAMSYVAPWAPATALTVTLSWLGVRGVVRDVVRDVVRGAVSDRESPPIPADPSVRVYEY